MVLTLQSPPDLLTKHWQLTVNRADKRALSLYERHYSAYQYADEREREQFVAPGEYVALMTADLKALFVWSKQKFRADGQQGVNCAVFRNEGVLDDNGEKLKSSLLIIEAMGVALNRWGCKRQFTFIDPKAVRSTNPGCCFKKAGWTDCGESAEGLLILEWIPAF
jgi:hypothetical protein